MTVHGADARAEPRAEELFAGIAPPETRIFISYRRQDTLAYATHLHASLARRFGADKIFRDVASLEPGEDYRAVIERAISSSDVVIALIGKRWLNIKSRSGQRRLDDPEDLLRLELEAALSHEVSVIPVLVDGATMPLAEDLPTTLLRLQQLNAYPFQWHADVGALTKRVKEVERQRAAADAAAKAARDRLDLTARIKMPKQVKAQNVVITAMQMSLRYQGHRVFLDPQDLDDQVRRHTGRPLAEGFIFSDLIYVIDHLGIRAKRSAARYTARSYPLGSFEDIPSQITLGRPVLAGATAFASWFTEPVTRTGLIETIGDRDQIQGGVVVAIVGYDPGRSQFRFLTPWPSWGDRGFGSISEQAVARSIQSDIRSIEPARMMPPFTPVHTQGRGS